MKLFIVLMLSASLAYSATPPKKKVVKKQTVAVEKLSGVKAKKKIFWILGPRKRSRK